MGQWQLLIGLRALLLANQVARGGYAGSGADVRTGGESTSVSRPSVGPPPALPRPASRGRADLTPSRLRHDQWGRRVRTDSSNSLLARGICRAARPHSEALGRDRPPATVGPMRRGGRAVGGDCLRLARERKVGHGRQLSSSGEGGSLPRFPALPSRDLAGSRAARPGRAFVPAGGARAPGGQRGQAAPHGRPATPGGAVAPTKTGISKRPPAPRPGTCRRPQGGDSLMGRSLRVHRVASTVRCRRSGW